MTACIKIHCCMMYSLCWGSLNWLVCSRCKTYIIYGIVLNEIQKMFYYVNGTPTCAIFDLIKKVS